MKKRASERIQEEFLCCVTNTIKRIKKQRKKSSQPFHQRLLSEDILRISTFERSFSTSFGQRVIETISKIIASEEKETSDVTCQKKTIITLSHETIVSVNDHIRLLRENRLGRPPCWESDIKDIKISKKGPRNNHIIRSDLWFLRGGAEYFFSIKTPKPNIDQTQEAKCDMLKLKASNNNFKTYFALPYNPSGATKTEYRHNPPFKIFDMINDEVVLIGQEYWDLLGGSGTYERILDIAGSVGKKTKNIIDCYIKDGA